MYRSIDNDIAPGGRVTVRLAVEADAPALARLAALDGAAVPAGPVLVAVTDGETVAALPLRGGRPIADPFRRTAAMLELLALRAAQLSGDACGEGTAAGRLRALIRAPRALFSR